MYTHDLEVDIVDPDIGTNGVFIFFKEFFLSAFADDAYFTFVFNIGIVDEASSVIYFLGVNTDLISSE